MELREVVPGSLLRTFGISLVPGWKDTEVISCVLTSLAIQLINQ